MKKNEQTNMIQVARPMVGEEEVEAVREVLFSGRYASGPAVEAFERKFADYVGVKHAVAVNSGTAALHVALAVLGIGPGDEVIVPPLTFFSTVTAVLHQNAIPVFADINPDSWCLDPDDVKQKITGRTRAIIPVHLYGQSANMDGFRALAQEHDIAIIEDAAQAHGTEYRGKKVGSMGDMGAFSFFATKHMTTGEGGAITTDNGEWADLARKIRSHGMTGRNDHDYLGYNYRMNEIAAAMGSVQLDRLDELNQRRIENSTYLLDQLSSLEKDWFQTPVLFDYVKHTFFWCPIWIDEERLGCSTLDLRERLLEKGIETRHRYKEPLYRQKILTDQTAYPGGFPFQSDHYPEPVDYSSVHLPRVENVAGRTLGLPNRPDLTESDLQRIVTAISEIEP